jgi:hypothetical protein
VDASVVAGADVVFGDGWYPPERSDALVWRWAGRSASIAIRAPEPWQEIRVHHHFVEAVRHGAWFEVSSPGMVTGGFLDWVAPGWRTGTVRLAEPVPAGRAELEVSSLQVWREPAGRELSVAVMWIELRSG